MEERININVSSTEYDNTSKAIKNTLTLIEEMVHGQDDFVITDSEFAFGWHFYVLSVNRELVYKLSLLIVLRKISYFLGQFINDFTISSSLLNFQKKIYS